MSFNPPTNLTAIELFTSGSVTGSVSSSGNPYVHLSWQDNSTVEKVFKIQRSDNGGSYSLIGTTISNIVYFNDANIRTNHTYSYRVRAGKTIGGPYTGWSNIAIISI